MLPSFFGYLVTRNPLWLVPELLRMFSWGYLDLDSLLLSVSWGRYSSFPSLYTTAAAASGLGPSLNLYHSAFLSFLHRAAATPNLITIPDVLRIGSGYLMFVFNSALVLALVKILLTTTAMQDARMSRKASLLLRVVAGVADVVKVG
jgi:hypothetical protein